MSSSDEVRLCGVHYSVIHEVWEEVYPMLIKTLEYADNKYDIETIYKNLVEREMQLWLVFQSDNILIAYMITQIVQYPTHKRLSNLFVGGSRIFKWLKFLEDIKNWAKSQGCTAIEGYGRPGWERILEKYGYKKIHTVYKLEI